MKLSPGNRYDDEIDLTASPQKSVTMAAENDAIDLTEADESETEEEDVKPTIKVHNGKFKANSYVPNFEHHENMPI